MISGHRRKYGLDWPKEYHDIFIDLVCAKKWREYPYCKGKLDHPADHMLRAMRSLFTAQELSISKWTEQHALDFTTEKFCITLGCASCSKAQPLDAQVCTPFGYRNMGSLAVGDLVVSQDGQPTKIIKIHELGEQPEYVVSFKDGTSTRCAGSHLWYVGRRSGGAQLAVIPTDHLARLASGSMYVPLCDPVNFFSSALPIDPYVLGCLLGDGHFGGSSGTTPLSITSTDADILSGIQARLDPDYELVETRKPTFRIVKKTRAHGASNSYIQRLKALDLWGKCAWEKHIPEIYLTGDVSSRWELLAGLLDTDGRCGKNGRISFSSTSKLLADGVATLVRSLGGMARVAEYKSGYSKNGVYIPCRRVFCVRISLNDPSKAFKCKRKFDRICMDRRGQSRRYIVSVELTGKKVPMRCITVDHTSGLYLTNDFIVTHNSNDYGAMMLLDWLVDPMETLTIIASTTVDMLKIRSYEAVIRYFKILKRNPHFYIPGKESKTTTAILNEDDDENVTTVKASIRGVAVSAGSVDEAKGRLQGGHLPYCRLVGDELANMRPAFMEARVNMSIGAKDFRLFGLANPLSITDLACRYCEPDVPGGWAAVSKDDIEWRSRYGKVRHHNGLQSPAILEPDGALKYPYLINKEQIDNIIKEHHGDDAPAVWTQVYGFPVPKGSDRAVISEREIITFKAREAPIWANESEIQRLGALDPAFTADGDGCVLESASLGRLDTGQAALVFDEPLYIPISASSDKPVAYQIVDTLRSELGTRGIILNNFAIDSSGNASIADIIEREIGRGIYSVNYAWGATEGKLSALATDSADQRYKNIISEAWALLAEFVRFGQVRSLPVEVIQQVTKRQYKTVAASKLRILESKSDYKKRTGLGSPDASDAAAMVCLVARDRLGFLPGGAPGGVANASGYGQQSLITGHRQIKPTYLVAYPFHKRYSVL